MCLPGSETSSTTPSLPHKVSIGWPHKASQGHPIEIYRNKHANNINPLAPRILATVYPKLSVLVPRNLCVGAQCLPPGAQIKVRSAVPAYNSFWAPGGRLLGTNAVILGHQHFFLRYQYGDFGVQSGKLLGTRIQ